MITRLRSALSRQLSHPAGAGGRLIAGLMNRGNRDLNRRAIDLLDVHAATQVLDLGFGGGLTLPILLARAARVTGVDRARDMVEAAERRHADAVGSGRLILRVGDVQHIPLPDAAVDRILSVNTVYFWPDLTTALAELHRVLASGGRLVLGIRDGRVMQRVDTSIFSIRTPAEITDALRATGFHDASTTSAPDGRTHLLSATKPG